MIQDKIYVFYYNPCIHESASAAISFHKTREGAERAMEKYVEEERAEYNSLWPEHFRIENNLKFENHRDWFIEEEIIED
jgi:hypothetical protein